MKKIIVYILFVSFYSLNAAFASTQLSEILVNEKNLDQNLAKQTVEQVFDSIKAALARGESVQVRNFGTFYLQRRKERNAINPKTKAAIKVPARNYARFRASDNFKEELFKSNTANEVSPQKVEEVKSTEIEVIH